MKTRSAGSVKYPKLYQSFKTADEIGKAINRSRSYVFKALKKGFTEHEWEMLNERLANGRTTN